MVQPPGNILAFIVLYMRTPVDSNSLPQHIAIIMDGNGRWAQKKHLPRQEGHRKGSAAAKQVLETVIGYKIPYLTYYVFSTENWNRPKTEVEGILRLLEQNLDEGIRYALDKGIKIRHFGKLDNLSPQLQEKIREAVELTRNNSLITVGLAFNYGGRDEIVNAVQGIIQRGITSNSISESAINQNLYTAGIPDPDLIIRTGGEMRLSNFLLWQAAYAEIYFTPVLWPDFDKHEVDKALAAYGKRKRRFGALANEQE
jgi:undecaprenyl diphosphate synthase